MLSNALMDKNQTVKRENWIDCLRGFCMFLVVFMHVENFTIGLKSSESVVMQIIFAFFLTTFFFISGYVSYKNHIEWNFKFTLSQLVKKFRQFIIPSIIFNILYNTCFVEKPFRFLTEGFLGYWFLVVLFEVFVIYYTVNYLCYLFKVIHFETIIIVTATFIVLFPYICPINEVFYKIFSISNLTTYFPFFIIGVLSKKYINIFKYIINSKWMFTFSFIVFIVIEYIICSSHTSDMYLIYGKVGFLIQMLVKYFATYLLVAIFYRNADYFSSELLCAKYLGSLGKRTLDVYLIHFFFIPSIPMLNIYVQDGKNPLLEIVLSALIAIFLIVLPYILGACIRSDKFLRILLLGLK